MGGLLREREPVKFRFIFSEKAYFPVAFMCRHLKVSPSGFYAWCRRPESTRAKEDRRLAVLVREAHELGRKAYGSPRVHRELKAQGVGISRKRVIRLMQHQGIKGKTRRRWVRTTDSNHSLPVAPNLLARDFQASGPNQRWVGDITYLRTPEGWLFLAAILDLYSRMVVGWATSAVIDRHLVLHALDMALKRRGPGLGLLHHSDQGSQYASEDYQKMLEAKGITCSMSRRGDCYDNAAMESWFGTLKTELGESFPSHAEGKRQLFDYIEVFYNQKRRHSSLGYVSPAEFERGSTIRRVAA
jgi:transposase InsO family protein